MSKKTSFFIFQALLIIIGFSVSVLYTPDTLKNLNGFQLSKRLITYTPAAEYTVQDSITASGSEEAPAPDGFGPGVLFGIALLVAFLAAVAVIPLAYFNPGPARMAAILSGVIFIIIIFVLTIIPKDIGIYFGLEEKNISFFSLLSIFRQGAYLIAAAMIFSIFGVFSPGEDFDKQPLKGNVKFLKTDQGKIIAAVIFLIFYLLPAYATPWAGGHDPHAITGFSDVIDKFFHAFYPGQWLTTPLFFILFIAWAWDLLSLLVTRMEIKMLEAMHTKK